MKEKTKNSVFRINNLTFFLLWVVLLAGMSQLSNAVFMQFYLWMQQSAPDTLSRVILLNGLISVAFTAPVEKALLRLRSGQWIRGWISSRFLSIVLAAMPSILLQNVNLQSLVINNPENILQLSLFAALFTLPQVWVLRRYVQNSWQYMIAGVLISLIHVVLASNFADAKFFAPFTFGSSLAIIALSILWLFSKPLNEEKTKRSDAITTERREDNLAKTEAEFEEDERVYENQLDR